MKVSELCKMVQDSIHSGKYPLEDNQRDWANSIQVINISSSYDLKSRYKDRSKITRTICAEQLYIGSAAFARNY